MVHHHPLTWAEFERLSPAEKAAWMRNLFTAWEQNAASDEVYYTLTEEQDFEDRHGTGCEAQGRKL